MPDRPAPIRNGHSRALDVGQLLARERAINTRLREAIQGQNARFSAMKRILCVAIDRLPEDQRLFLVADVDAAERRYPSVEVEGEPGPAQALRVSVHDEPDEADEEPEGAPPPEPPRLVTGADAQRALDVQREAERQRAVKTDPLGGIPVRPRIVT